MAKVKAKVSFAGVVTMGVGEVRDITDKAIVKDLVQAGYVEKVKETSNSKTSEKEDEQEGEAMNEQEGEAVNEPEGKAVNEPEGKAVNEPEGEAKGDSK